jgi:hypothetical protein
MHYLLFTECLQNDFVAPIGPGERLPNTLHIGRSESRRLLGNPETPWQSEGPMARFLKGWMHDRGPDHHAFHLRDWHDPQDLQTQPHLAHFGPHCLQHTEGARFIAPLEAILAEGGQEAVVDAAVLSDFIGTDLEPRLRATLADGAPVRAGIIGVWTDVKVRYLAYDLITRLGLSDIAVCSALTASSSHIHHREALDHLRSGLGVTVIDSIPEFQAWLGLSKSSASVSLRGRHAPTLTVAGERTLGDEERQLVEYLFRDCAEVTLKPLGGGFSGSSVFMTESVDRLGMRQIPFVVKMDTHAKVAKERAAVESVENVLGSVSPRLSDFADLENLGAIKYQFATMHGGKVRTLKALFQAAEGPQAVRALCGNVVERVLRRLYQKTFIDRQQLYRYYDFQPRYGETTLAIAAELGARPAGDQIEIPGLAGTFADPRRFYASLPDRLAGEPEEVPCGWIHGDLNLANLLLDESGNTWMIDYFWTRVGHAVQDLAKLENDLKFILVPLPDEAALARAVAWDRLLMADDDQMALAPDLPADLAADKDLAKAHAAIAVLRELRRELLLDTGCTAPVSNKAYWLSQLRYSAHTLTFDECDVRQRRFALASTALLAGRLVSL